jgi:type IV pilus biogenesis protein CpaD/CtpE
MRNAILGLLIVLLTGCADSARDKKLDAIIERLDSIEQKLNEQRVDIEALKGDVSDCAR